MERMLLTAALSFVLVGCAKRYEPMVKPAGYQELTFDALDHHKVYADFYPSGTPNSKKVILMFHQAGSNAGEYETIAPKLTKLGFDCIAVDQRSGGDMWGRTNRTTERSGKGEYMDAYNDLIGALNYADSQHYRSIIAWGSSYSASLVLRLASQHKEVNAVFTFSPGEYMDDKTVVKSWADEVTVPVFFACTPGEWTDGRSDLFAAIPAKNKVACHLEGGVHGASTLISFKSTAFGEYWAQVNAFLQNLKLN
jgi:dienelactone hydrolase